MFQKWLLIASAIALAPFYAAAAEKDAMLRAGEWEMVMRSEGSGGAPTEFKTTSCMGAEEASGQLGTYAPNYGNKGSFESNDGDCKIKFNADDGKSVMESSCKDGTSSKMEATYSADSYKVEIVAISGSEKSITSVVGKRLGDCAKKE